MLISVGVVAALIALLAWGFGDFFIQRSIRAIGSLESLLCIGITGAILLFPFVARDVVRLFQDSASVSFLILATIITFIGAVILFAAFKQGKLAVVEPILSFELLITTFISLAFLKEAVTGTQLVLILAVFVGIILIIIHREKPRWWQWWKRSTFFERGALLAVLGAGSSACINVVTALASRQTDPIVTIWFVHGGIGVISFVWIAANGRLGAMVRSIRKNIKTVSAQSVLDNVAWLAYAKAVTTLPIAITVGITESFVALAALLGIAFNKEKLTALQIAGIGITLCAAIALAVTSQ